MPQRTEIAPGTLYMLILKILQKWLRPRLQQLGSEISEFDRIMKAVYRVIETA